MFLQASPAPFRRLRKDFHQLAERLSTQVCWPLCVHVQTQIQQVTLEVPPVFNIWFDTWIGRQPSPSTKIPIIKNFTSDEERPQKVADLFLGWLGEEEIVYVGEGEDVPLVSDCQDQRMHLPELGYDVPVVSSYRPREEESKEEEARVAENNSDKDRKEDLEIDRQDKYDLLEECTGLGGEVMCSWKNNKKRKVEKSQKEIGTGVGEEKEGDGIECN